MGKEYTIELFNDMFDVKGYNAPYVLDLNDGLYFANYKDTALLHEDILLSYFKKDLETMPNHTMINRELSYRIKHTFLTVHLMDNMPDLSVGRLCYSNDRQCKNMQWGMVLNLVLATALFWKDFYVDLHTGNPDDICVAFKVTSNDVNCLIDLYFNEEAKKLHKKSIADMIGGFL